MRIEFPVNGAHANVISDCFASNSPIKGRIDEPEITIPPEGEDVGSLTWETSPHAVAMLVHELERGIPEYEADNEPESVTASRDMIEKFRGYI